MIRGVRLLGGVAAYWATFWITFYSLTNPLDPEQFKYMGSPQREYFFSHVHWLFILPFVGFIIGYGVSLILTKQLTSTDNVSLYAFLSTAGHVLFGLIFFFLPFLFFWVVMMGFGIKPDS